MVSSRLRFRFVPDDGVSGCVWPFVVPFVTGVGAIFGLRAIWMSDGKEIGGASAGMDLLGVSHTVSRLERTRERLTVRKWTAID